MGGNIGIAAALRFKQFLSASFMELKLYYFTVKGRTFSIVF
jgi:hypothetical protein